MTRPRVPGDQVRHHLDQLLASGWTITDIAQLSGVHRRTLGAIIAGQRTVRADTADAIRAVEPLTPHGLRHHLEQLVAAGMTVADIAAEAGVTTPTVRLHLRRDDARTWAGTAAALAAVRPPRPDRNLDPAPLLSAVAGRPLGPTDRTALYRARQSGRISESIADRIAIRAGVGPLMLIYREVAA